MDKTRPNEIAAGLVRSETNDTAVVAGRYRVLVVDDDPRLCRAMMHELKDRYDVSQAASYGSAIRALAETPAWHAVISDLDLGGGPSGIDVLAFARTAHPGCVRVLLSAVVNEESIRPSLASGVIEHFLAKPWHAGELLFRVDAAMAMAPSIQLGDTGDG